MRAEAIGRGRRTDDLDLVALRPQALRERAHVFIDAAGQRKIVRADEADFHRAAGDAAEPAEERCTGIRLSMPPLNATFSAPSPWTTGAGAPTAGRASTADALALWLLIVFL